MGQFQDDRIAQEWQRIVEFDDRTSPEEYPDHALLTFDEFRDAVRRVSFGPEGDNHHNAAECPYCSPREPGVLDLDPALAGGR